MIEILILVLVLALGLPLIAFDIRIRKIEDALRKQGKLEL